MSSSPDINPSIALQLDHCSSLNNFYSLVFPQHNQTLTNPEQYSPISTFRKEKQTMSLHSATTSTGCLFQPESSTKLIPCATCTNVSYSTKPPLPHTSLTLLHVLDPGHSKTVKAKGVPSLNCHSYRTCDLFECSCA